MDARTQEADLGLTGPANPNLPSLILVGDSTVRNGQDTGNDGQWGWGTEFLDYNNDGLLDIYAVNGFVSGPVLDDV